MRLRWALSFEKACSIGFRSGLYGGKYRNQDLCLHSVAAASAFLWVARLSQITTVPGSISGTSTSRTYAANAAPSMAPLITHGAINRLCANSAMKVCVPQAPNGADEVSLVPRMDRPHGRVMFIFTLVSSMNTAFEAEEQLKEAASGTNRAGLLLHGAFCARPRCGSFFERITQPAQYLVYSGHRSSHAMRILKRRLQFL